jgi:hypothetical protein
MAILTSKLNPSLPLSMKNFCTVVYKSYKNKRTLCGHCCLHRKVSMRQTGLDEDNGTCSFTVSGLVFSTFTMFYLCQRQGIRKTHIP